MKLIPENKLFLTVVVLPTLLAIAYFGLIASDVYISESSFVVRSPQQQMDSPLGQMLKGAGFTKSQDDSYLVQNYILSIDALKTLDDELHLRKLYSGPHIDFLSRFPGFGWGDSMDNFHHYYAKSIVQIEVDSSSSISTLTTRAYSAEDAFRINQRLLEMSEYLVNKLNERGRQDLISFADREVAEAANKDKEAALALAAYRNDKGVIDPEKESTIPLEQVAKLQDELVATKVQVEQMRHFASENPQLPGLQERMHLLEHEIKVASEQVAGPSEHSLAGKAAIYQRLALEKEFTGKMLASAMSTLEQARNEAQNKQLYLERISQPSKPDAPAEPKRLRDIVMTFIISLIVWGILSLLAAGIKEHHD